MKKMTRRSMIAGMMASSILPSMRFADANDSLESLKVMTEDYPPYSHSDNGELKGISVDIMVEVFKRAKCGHDRSDIELLPWARGYNLTLQSRGHALFSTTRTADRENLFKWVGPFVPTIVGLTAHKDRHLKINTIDDLFSLRVGVVKDDVGQLLLKAQGFPESRMDVVLSNRQNYRKLMAGRVDAIAYETEVTKWGLRQLKADLGKFEVIYKLKSSDLYLALHRDTPDEMVNQLQAAFNEIVADGTHAKILASHINR